MSTKSVNKCAKCGITYSLMWEKNEKNEVLCNVCGVLDAPSTSTGQRRQPNFVQPRKSRGTAPVPKPDSTQKVTSKVRSKKAAPKKTCYDPPPAFAIPVSKPLLHEGAYYQHGDIVSLSDGTGTAYAQIRGLLQDQYCEKYAVITWLVPTKLSPENGFDPDTYLIGVNEEMPRKLSGMKFVCNAPSERYLCRSVTYPPYPPLRPEFGVLYKKTGPEIIRLLPDDEYYNPYDDPPRKSLCTAGRVKIPPPEPKKTGKRSKKSRY